jgi:hypothetical protein
MPPKKSHPKIGADIGAITGILLKLYHYTILSFDRIDCITHDQLTLFLTKPPSSIYSQNNVCVSSVSEKDSSYYYITIKYRYE